MVENKRFDLKLKSEMLQKIKSLTHEDWIKYSYALKHKIFDASYYNNMEISSFDDFVYKMTSLRSSFIVLFPQDIDFNNFLKKLYKIIEDSSFINYTVTICDDTELLNNINLAIEGLSDDELNKLNSYSVPSLPDISSKLIDILYTKLRDNKANTEEIFNSLLEYNKNIEDNKKFIYDLINKILDDLEKKNVISCSKVLNIYDAEKFNKDRKDCYQLFFSSIGYEKYFEEQFDELLEQIIDITYSSASNKVTYDVFVNQDLVILNNHFFPKNFVIKLLFDLPTMLDSAMTNYYMFLSGDNVSFSDEDGKKYLFPVDSIHILGLEDRMNPILGYFAKKVKKSDYSFSDFLNDYNEEDYEFLGNIADVNGDLSRCISHIKNASTSLKVKVSSLFTAQSIVTQHMISNDYNQKIGLLVYFYNKKYKEVVPDDSSVGEKITGKSIDVDCLESILDEYAYCFDNAFIKEFKTDNKRIIEDFCDRYNDENSCNAILAKYNELFKLQEFLTYQSRKIVCEIVKKAKITKNGQAFIKGEDAKYLNERLFKFALADVYLKAQIKDLNELMSNGVISDSININLFKIYDKLLYLTSFNQSIDITNLFVTDLQSKESCGFIAEMMALNSVVLALYEYVDNFGSTHFVSIQDAETLLSMSSMTSLIPSLINFDNKYYKSILGLALGEKDKISNILTQTHSDYTKYQRNLEKVCSQLEEDRLFLRYATSGEIKSNSVAPVAGASLSDMSKIDLVKRNLCGCSNALLWLETVSDRELMQFFNISDNPKYNDDKYKLLRIQLYKKIQLDIMSLKSNLDITKLSTDPGCEEANLLNKLISYGDNFNIEALEAILKLDENDMSTFTYFENMTNESFELFKRNLFLSYPPYIIKYLFNKLSQLDYISNNRLKEILDCLVYIVDYSLLSDPINLNSLVSKKDEDYPLLLFLENGISRYSNFIKDYPLSGCLEIGFASNKQLKDVLGDYASLIHFMEQKKNILSQKYADITKELDHNKNGVIGSIRNSMSNLSERSETISHEISRLEFYIEDYKKEVSCLMVINELLSTNPANISVEMVNRVFDLSSSLSNLSQDVEDLFLNRVNELLSKDEVKNNTQVFNALNELVVQKTCDKTLETEFNELIDCFEEKRKKSSREEEVLLTNQLSNIDRKTHNVYVRIYQHINVCFSSHPEYHKKYLNRLDYIIKKLCVDYNISDYTDPFSLFIEPTFIELNTDLTAIGMGYRARLREKTKEISSINDLSKLLMNFYISENNDISSACDKAYDNLTFILNNRGYLLTEEEKKLITNRINESISSVNVLDDIIDVSFVAYQNKLSDVIKRHVKQTELLRIMPIDITFKTGIKNREVFSLVIKHLVSDYLGQIVLFLNNIVTEQNGFTNVEDTIRQYYSSVRNRIVDDFKQYELGSIQLFTDEEEDIFAVRRY